MFWDLPFVKLPRLKLQLRKLLKEQFKLELLLSLDSAASEPEMRSPRAKLLWDKWRHVWMMAWDRQKRLHDHLVYLQELERVRQFSWDDWRKRVSFQIKNSIKSLHLIAT